MKYPSRYNYHFLNDKRYKIYVFYDQKHRLTDIGRIDVRVQEDQAFNFIEYVVQYLQMGSYSDRLLEICHHHNEWARAWSITRNGEVFLIQMIHMVITSNSGSIIMTASSYYSFAGCCLYLKIPDV